MHFRFIATFLKFTRGQIERIPKRVRERCEFGWIYYFKVFDVARWWHRVLRLWVVDFMSLSFIAILCQIFEDMLMNVLSRSIES